jgi:hypothetical protein
MLKLSYSLPDPNRTLPAVSYRAAKGSFVLDIGCLGQARFVERNLLGPTGHACEARLVVSIAPAKDQATIHYVFSLVTVHLFLSSSGPAREQMHRICTALPALLRN